MIGVWRSRWALPVAAIVAILVVVGAYSNSVHNAFHFDDLHVVVSNLYIRSLANLPRFYTDATTGTSLPTNAVYRPLMVTTLALDYWLGGGLRVEPFHRSQITMLIVLGALLFFLFRRIFDAADPQWWNGYLALLAALLFSVHATVTETMNLMHVR